MDSDPPKIVSLPLTPEQVLNLEPIFALQKERKKCAILSIVSMSYEPSCGAPVAKLETAWIPHRVAMKVCRLIREAQAKRTIVAFKLCLSP